MKKFLQKVFTRGYVCRQCGRRHSELPTDFGWLLPDDVWSLGEPARQEHLAWATDVAFLEGRWFVRGVLEIPFCEQKGRFGWGIWAEVNEEAMAEIRRNWDVDPTHQPRLMGSIANEIGLYPGLVGQDVEIHLPSPELRPTFWFPEGSNGLLAELQRVGMDLDEYHRVISFVQPTSG